MPAEAVPRIAASTLSPAGGYAQAALLLFGTYEVSTGRRVSRRRSQRLLIAACLLALTVVLLTVALSSEHRLAFRVGSRCLLAGAAFFVLRLECAARRLPQGEPRAQAPGRRLPALRPASAPLRRSSWSPSIGSATARLRPLSRTVDFLFQSLIGIGMVTWLLEDERQQVLAAADADRAPRLSRRADRPAQPQSVPRAPAPRARRRRGATRAARRPLPRPRPLQGDQRLAGPLAPATSCCRPSPTGCGPASAPRRHCGAPRRRRVHRPPPRRSRRGGDVVRVAEKLLS